MDAAYDVRSRTRASVQIGESVPPTPWDPALRPVLEHERLALYGEEVRTDLIEAMIEVGQHPARGLPSYAL